MRTGPNPGKTFTLSKNEIYIGRDITNDIVINDAEVSRKHARLTLQTGGYLLEDLGSTNGTFVDGKRVTGPVLLSMGQLIMLADNVSLGYEVAVYDPEATRVVPQGEPILTSPPPAPPGGLPPGTPLYAGQVPAGPAEAPPAPDAERRNQTQLWILAGCGCLLVLLCAVAVGAMFYIDSQSLWCQVAPFLPACP
jgi:pSer/pThr/pTyr-binding forkhead associated (FHA) protein